MPSRRGCLLSSIYLSIFLLLALLTLRRGALLLAGEHRRLGLVAVDAHLVRVRVGVRVRVEVGVEV